MPKNEEFNAATQFIAPFFVTDKKREARFKRRAKEIAAPELADEMRAEFHNEIGFALDSKSKLTGVLLDLEDHAEWEKLAESVGKITHADREISRRKAADDQKRQR